MTFGVRRVIRTRDRLNRNEQTAWSFPSPHSAEVGFRFDEEPEEFGGSATAMTSLRDASFETNRRLKETEDHF